MSEFWHNFLGTSILFLSIATLLMLAYATQENPKADTGELSADTTKET